MYKHSNQYQTPLYDALIQHAQLNPHSFHVPGHKNGSVFPDRAKEYFHDILQIDVTEITGLDDLHHPEEAIKEAQELLSHFVKSKQSFFLVGGSTAGNLAMVLASHQEGRPFLVQRNCHKSIIHALELAGAHPVFIEPVFEEQIGRYGPISKNHVEQALYEYPDAAGLVLTYPDYYGRTYDLQSMIGEAHQRQIPVLVDEAHGVHFSLGEPMPPSSVELGADVVVQSAHKMAPAMTMGAYLHLNSELVDQQDVRTYLQMVQSSSPSYPIMASLDLARSYLATFRNEMLQDVLQYIKEMRKILGSYPMWEVLSYKDGLDDPFKITLQMRDGLHTKEIVGHLEKEGIFPELVTDSQILLILGLEPTLDLHQLYERLQHVYKDWSATRPQGRDTIEHREVPAHLPKIKKLAYSYQSLSRMETTFISWEEAEGKIASQSVIPYPPGIPLIMKGERLEAFQIKHLQELRDRNVHIQTQESYIEEGIHIYIE